MQGAFKQTKSGLIFDFDYTLVDSSEAINHCVNETLERMHLAPATDEQIQSILADTLEVAYQKITGDDNPERAAEYAAHIRAIQADLTDFKTKFFEGVHESLEKLHDEGIKLGIVSSNDKVNIERFLKQERALKMFDTILGATCVSVYKPHPQGLYRAMKEMGLTQKEVIFLGDSLHDAGAAKNASVDFMGVLTGHATADCFDTLPHIGVHASTPDAIEVISENHLG